MKRITHVDGIEVVLQSDAYGPHPRWRDRQVVISGVTHLVLADEREMYACNTCGDIRDSVASVVSHMASHTERGPMYPPETIKSVIREVLRHDDKRNKCELAATALNQKGVETLNGDKWYASTVSGLYRRYKDDPEYKVRRPARPKATLPDQRESNDTPTPVVAKVATATTTTEDQLVARLLNLGERMYDVAQGIESLVPDIALALAEGKIDPEIVAKAAKWDAAQALFSNNQ